MHLRTAPTQLRLFVAASGLPVRVTKTATFEGSYEDREETDILAINALVLARPPATGSVISEVESLHYFGLTLFRKTKPCSGIPQRAPIGG